jgi:hypothetical protein
MPALRHLGLCLALLLPLADPARLRSPMVSRCIEDYLSGQRYPLDLIRAVPAG